jgi:hypothetical protein
VGRIGSKTLRQADGQKTDTDAQMTRQVRLNAVSYTDSPYLNQMCKTDSTALKYKLNICEPYNLHSKICNSNSKLYMCSKKD